MKLGINSYTFMWAIGFPGATPPAPLTALGLLDKARQLGVRLVQTGPNLSFASEEEFQVFFHAAQAQNITLELGTRGLETDHLVRWTERCAQAGARLLRTIPEIMGETPSPEAAVQYLIAIRPELERFNVTLGLENGKIPCRNLRQIIAQVESPRIGVVLDMVNSLAVPEGWREVTQVLAPYTVCLHFKDFTMRRAWHMMGFICEGCPAGKGQLDMQWLLEALRLARDDFNVILELWPPQQPTLAETIALEQAWAVESIQFLRQFIPE
jgi:sugar phosphate isomerase/epimerase